MTKTLLIAIALILMTASLDAHAGSKGTYIDSDVLDYSASIAGTDVNNNGVRDDVENYIDSLPDSEAQKNALKQVSQAINEAMELVVNGDVSSSKLHATSWTVSKAVVCLWSQYDDSFTANKQLKLIRQITANTPERFKAYMEYNSALSGSAIEIPNENFCDD